MDEIWSIDLADKIEYKTSNHKGYWCILIIIDNFSQFVWAISLMNKNSKTKTDEFSNNLSSSKRRAIKLESDRGSEGHSSFFQNFLQTKNVQHYSRITDKEPSIAKRVFRTIRNFLKKAVFEKEGAIWLGELPSVIKKYSNTVHDSRKMTPIQDSEKSNEKEGYSNLQNRRDIHKPKFELGQPVRLADIEKVFSKRDSTNWSYKLYTTIEVIHDTITTYSIVFLPERYD